MNNIDKYRATEILNTLINDIEELQSLSFLDKKFKIWEQKVLASIKHIFGDKCKYKEKIEEIILIDKSNYFYFTEPEIQQLHIKNLDEVKIFLISIVDEIKTFWDDSNTINLKDKNWWLIDINSKKVILSDGKNIELTEEIFNIVKNFIDNHTD